MSANRYASVAKLIYRAPSGREVTFYARRFSPQASSMPELSTLKTRRDDRPDLVATRGLGNPLLYWRVCDANDAIDPFELTSRAERELRIPMPEPGK